jgi:polysaccharide transporter, PST family
MSDVRRAAQWAYAQYAVNALLPLMLLPYLTRVLAPSSFAQLAYFQAISVAIGLMVDFGLGQANLARMVHALGDARAEAEVAAEVTAARLTLLLPAAGLLAALAALAPTGEATALFFAFSFVHVACNGLSPFWIFQARMGFAAPVAVEVATRLAAFAAVFLVVREAHDGWKAQAALALGVLANLAWLFWKLPTGLPLAQAFSRVPSALRAGSRVFATRTAYQITPQLPLVALGWLAPPATVAAYAVAERLMRGLVSAALPLALASAPDLARSLASGALRPGGLSRRIGALAGILAVLALAVGLLAQPLGALVSAYPGQATLLRAMAAWVPIAGVNAFVLHAIVLPNYNRFSPARAVLGYLAATLAGTILLTGPAGPFAGVAALILADLLLGASLLAGLRRAVR